MKLNKSLKMLKALTVVLSIVTITACSSSKEINNSNQSTKDMVGSNITGSDIFSEKKAFFQTQHLQQNDTIYFDFNKHNIRPNFVEMLDAHADFLRKNPSCKIIIEGHTDERGTSEYNIALGERRARAVKIYLQGKGVYSDQISVISYGKEKPAVQGHDEVDYAKNRRAILIY